MNPLRAVEVPKTKIADVFTPHAYRLPSASAREKGPWMMFRDGARGALALVWLLSAVGWPTLAAADGVVVPPFDGPGAARVRGAVVSALKDDFRLVRTQDTNDTASKLGVSLDDVTGRAAVSRRLGVSAWVVGKVTKHDRKLFEAVIEVIDARDGSSLGLTSYEAKNPRALAAAVAKGFHDDAAGSVASGHVPDPEPEREPAPQPMVESTPEDEERDEERDESPDELRALPEEGEPSGPRPSPFDAELGFVGFSRSFEYNDDLSGLRTYSLGVGPALAFGVRYYPMAHVDDGPLAHIGLDVRGRFAFAIDSEIGDTSFPTSAHALHLGLRGRIPISQSELALFAGYGIQQFAIDAASAEQGLRVEPGVPASELSMLRVGAAARIALGDVWTLGASAAYLMVLSTGELEDWFPNEDGAAGAELELSLEHELSGALSLGLTLGVSRIAYAFAPTVEDAAAGLPVAGGATDTSFFGGLGMRFELSGGGS